MPSLLAICPSSRPRHLMTVGEHNLDSRNRLKWHTNLRHATLKLFNYWVRHKFNSKNNQGNTTGLCSFTNESRHMYRLTCRSKRNSSTPFTFYCEAGWQVWRLASGGSQVRIPLQPQRRDFGQVLHPQLPVALRRVNSNAVGLSML